MPSVSQQTLSKMVTNEETMATPLLLVFADTFEDEFPADENDENESPFDWDPATILQEMEEHFGDLPQGNFDRLMMAIAISKTDRFYHDLDFFLKACNVLAGHPLNPDHFDPAHAFECAWGIVEGCLIEPPEHPDSPFSEEIVSYMARMLDEEGIVHPPGLLQLKDRSQNLVTKIQETFADDPETYDHIVRTQQDKIRLLNEGLRDRMSEYSAQMEQLPLKHGDTSDWLQRLLNFVKGLGSK
jgi:hypothetical protein